MNSHLIPSASGSRLTKLDHLAGRAAWVGSWMGSGLQQHLCKYRHQEIKGTILQQLYKSWWISMNTACTLDLKHKCWIVDFRPPEVVHQFWPCWETHSIRDVWIRWTLYLCCKRFPHQVCCVVLWYSWQGTAGSRQDLPERKFKQGSSGWPQLYARWTLFVFSACHHMVNPSFQLFSQSEFSEGWWQGQPLNWIRN